MTLDLGFDQDSSADDSVAPVAELTACVRGNVEMSRRIGLSSWVETG